MNTKFWLLKIFALGVSLGIVLWAIEVLRHRDVPTDAPTVTNEMPAQPIPAKVKTGPRNRRDR